MAEFSNASSSTTGDRIVLSNVAGEAVVHYCRIFSEQTTATVDRTGFVRESGGTANVTPTAELMSTRSPAFGGSLIDGYSVLPTATQELWFAVGVGNARRNEWRPPRPWACWKFINGEKGGAGLTGGTEVEDVTLLFQDAMVVAGRVPGRRGSRRGLWHWASHQNNRSGGINQVVAMPPASWVAYRRINPEWRMTNTLQVQLTSLPPIIQTPQILARRFPMPEVYQRLATVSNNFGQVAFPLLGSWQPGTMDPPFVRAQYLLQEITPVPLPVGPPPALVPPPQPATTIPSISSAFYQQHPAPVTTAPAVGGIGGMTWYWP